MSNWFTKNLGDALLAEAPLEQLKEQFESAFEQAHRPADMAAYIRHESEGRLHCEVKVYFSPAAAPVARLVEAVPCPRPSPDGLGFLVGSEKAWSRLFPDSRGGWHG